jgi:hypothetical protein
MIRRVHAMLSNDQDYRLCVMRLNDQSVLFEAAKIPVICRGCGETIYHLIKKQHVRGCDR